MQNQTTRNQTTQIELLNEKVSGLNKIVLETSVRNDDDLSKVSDIIKNIKSFEKIVKAEMDKVIKPAKEIIDNTKLKYDPYLKACINAEQALKAKAGLYLTQKEEERKAQEAKVVEKLEQGKIKESTAIKKMEAIGEEKKTVSTENSSLSVRKIKDIEITDESVVPKEYWVLDLVKIKKVALAGVDIPGVKVIEKTSIASR